LRVVPALVRRGDIVIDVGANRGVYTYAGLRAGCHVHAFEPNPELAIGLKVLGPKVTVHNVALSDRGGRATFFIPYDSDGDIGTRGSLHNDVDPDLAHRATTVRTASLDSFEFSAVGLVKIDVEGHELSVLRGSKETLGRCRPSLIVEVEDNRSEGIFAACTNVLEAQGFSGWWIDGAHVKPIAEFDPAVRQPAGARPRWGQEKPADYVNNFIWLPCERSADIEAIRETLSK
jgi:FkbM family methyltransferase